MATSKFVRMFMTTGQKPLLGANIWLVPQNNVYPDGALQLTAYSGREGMYYREGVPDGEYKIYIDAGGGSSPLLYEEKYWIGENKLSIIGTKFDATAKLTKEGLGDQLKTVESTTGTDPDYLGQIGIASNGERFIAIAKTGTKWRSYDTIASDEAAGLMSPLDKQRLNDLWGQTGNGFDYSVFINQGELTGDRDGFNKTFNITQKILEGSETIFCPVPLKRNVGYTIQHSDNGATVTLLVDAPGDTDILFYNAIKG